LRAGRPSRPASRAVIALALATATLGAGVIGCGGGSEGSSTAAGAVGRETGSGAVESPQQPSGARPEPKTGGAGSGREGGFEGGEEQVENSGSEAAGSEREVVLDVEQTYLTALRDGDYARACALVSRALDQSLQAMVASGAGTTSCKAILSRLVAGNATRAVEQQLNGRVTKVRIEGENGFVIFHAPGARLYAYPMVREGNAWKVGALNAAVLAPSAATLGEP
jgi:hypothetical protein